MGKKKKLHIFLYKFLKELPLHSSLTHFTIFWFLLNHTHWKFFQEKWFVRRVILSLVTNLVTNLVVLPGDLKTAKAHIKKAKKSFVPNVYKGGNELTILGN